MVALDPWSHEVFALRATVRCHTGDRAGGIEDLSRAIALAPREAEHHAWRGLYRLYEEGASAEAEADMRRAVELDPRGLVAHQLLAVYLSECERWEEAIRVHDARIEIEPRLASSYADRAVARLGLGRDEPTLRAALADLDAALAGGDDDPEVVEKRAEVLALLGGA